MSKIFAIGFNKTGANCLRKTMTDFGYKTINLMEAELLIQDYAKRNFSSIIKICEKYDFFHDGIFGLPYTFIALDISFPNSKFILTIIDDPEQWYKNFLKVHTNAWGGLTIEHLKNAKYRYKGFVWDFMRLGFNACESDPYSKDHSISLYNKHNSMVKDYFRFRPNDLLVINPEDINLYSQLCVFLNKKP